MKKTSKTPQNPGEGYIDRKLYSNKEMWKNPKTPQNNEEYYIEMENLLMRQNNVEHFVVHSQQKHELSRAHIHTAVEVLHILRGVFRIVVDEMEYTLKKGETVLIRSHALHRIAAESNEPGAYYVLKFKPEFVLQLTEQNWGASYLLDFALINNTAKTVWNEEESLPISRNIQRLSVEEDQPRYGTDVAIKICIAEIILILLRDIKEGNRHEESDNSSNLIRRIYDSIVYINQHYNEDISAEDCSNHVFLSYSYFSRSFKRITGRTFSDYLMMVRINHAEKMLISTQKPVSQIALECGFVNFSYFSAVYKKLKGSSPSSTRENAQKDGE